jgi:hypothetical protein
MWLNEYEVDTLAHHTQFVDMPVAFRGAQILSRFVDWVNRNSDGWPYWKAASSAASRLTSALYDRFYSAWGKRVRDDMTDADLAAALRQIKSLLTRHGASESDRLWILEGKHLQDVI